MTALDKARRDALALVASPDTSDTDADTIARVTLPALPDGSRWQFVNTLRFLDRRIHQLSHANIAKCLPGEAPDMAAERERGELRGLLTLTIGQAIECDGDAARFAAYVASHCEADTSVLVSAQNGSGS